VLIPVRHLAKRRHVMQVKLPRVAYFHVELDSHDVLLAEGLPAESYLDTGNRSAFANGGPAVMAHPDFAPQIWEVLSYAPLVVSGERLAAAKRMLLARAVALGHGVDGMRIDAERDGVSPNPGIARRDDRVRLTRSCPSHHKRTARFARSGVFAASDRAGNRRTPGACRRPHRAWPQ